MKALRKRQQLGSVEAYACACIAAQTCSCNCICACDCGPGQTQLMYSVWASPLNTAYFSTGNHSYDLIWQMSNNSAL